MRKITAEAFHAWCMGKPFNKSNTSVDEAGNVWLHGNLIVKRVGGHTFVSDGGWGWSMTTRERLSPWATFSRKNWEAFMNDSPYKSGTWVKVS